MKCTISTKKIGNKYFYKFFLFEYPSTKGITENDFIYIHVLSYSEIMNNDYYASTNILMDIAREKGFDGESLDSICKVFEELYNDLMKQRRKKEEQQGKRDWEDPYKMFEGIEIKKYTDKEKEFLKIIYRAASMKLHPDVTKDNGEGMQFLNQLKEEWGIK